MKDIIQRVFSKLSTIERKISTGINDKLVKSVDNFIFLFIKSTYERDNYIK